MNKNILDLQKLYRFPWTTYNNPNGWIEPTTYCQLACPGCYRGLDQPSPPRIHENIEKLKKDIDTLVKIRKIETLSVAGGEPLLYPQLDKLIKYAHKRNLKVKIVTNGWALTKSRLQSLKEAGANEIVIHLASYQKREKFYTEDELDKIRANYCQMFREIKDVDLQFIMTVNSQNIKGVPRIIDFYKKNSDIVSHFIFTIYQELQPDTKSKKQNKVKVDQLRKIIEKKYKIQPCAYLPKKLNPQKASWLFYLPIFHSNKLLGYSDGKTIEKITRKKEIKGGELFPINGNTIDLLKTINIFLEPTVLKIAWKYLLDIIKNPKSILEKIRYQVIIILNTPDFTEKGWDICGGCPDAMLHEGKLVPSCALELIKKGEEINL